MPDTDAPKEHGALRERIVDRLRDDIIHGRIAPGSQLRTEEVMERFGVSNSPLREAFAQLQAEGLVDVYRNRGAYVAPVTREGARDLIRVSGVLWDTMYRWAVPRLTSGDLAELERIKAAFDEAHRTGEARTALTAAAMFHRHLTDQCGSPELLRAIGALRLRVWRIVRMSDMPDEVQVYTRFNDEILAAARTGDAERAVAALVVFRGHLSAAVDTLSLPDS